MLLPRILTRGSGCTVLSVLRTSTSSTSSSSSSSTLLQLGRPTLPATVPSLAIGGIRWATHKASRPANKGKDGPGKRLGAKKTAGEQVKTGMIIYRQRGTVWFPGENAGCGRDHTIYALQPGFVRYYKDPAHPKRKFIGVALTATQKLPTPANAVTRRRLGREPVPLIEINKRNTLDEGELETLKTGMYYYRPPNWKLGLVQDEIKKPYDPKNTWARWQKRAKRVKFAKARRGIGGKDTKPKKKAKRRQ